jgi:L-lactate utilization protein LutB
MDEIKLTIKNLEKNKMKAYYAENRDEARELVMSMIDKNSTVGAGGSLTLDECNIREELRDKGYSFFDWFAKGIKPEEKREKLLKSLTCDVYLTSANAVTVDGKLLNCDGRGNRVAAMAYGPEKVIVVAGKNKIEKDLKEAFERLESVAAPLNAKQLDKKVPCVKTGYCVDCSVPERICCHTLIQEYQTIKDRINVVIVNEDLGL